MLARARCHWWMRMCAQPSTRILIIRRHGEYGAEAVMWVDTGGKWRNTCWSRTSPPALGHKSCVVAALIARVVSCSDFRLASHVSHSRTERHLSLASQHAVAADVVQICKSCPGPLHRRERAYAGSRNMKVDRIGALHNSYLCTRCLRVRHLANGFNSRRRQTSLRAPPDCRGGSVWVGSALKKV